MGPSIELPVETFFRLAESLELGAEIGAAAGEASLSGIVSDCGCSVDFFGKVAAVPCFGGIRVQLSPC